MRGEASAFTEFQAPEPETLLCQETEDERQARYAREADEMKLKWDARSGYMRLHACETLKTSGLYGGISLRVPYIQGGVLQRPNKGTAKNTRMDARHVTVSVILGANV